MMRVEIGTVFGNNSLLFREFNSSNILPCLPVGVFKHYLHHFYLLVIFILLLLLLYWRARARTANEKPEEAQEYEKCKHCALKQTVFVSAMFLCILKDTDDDVEMYRCMYSYLLFVL